MKGVLRLESNSIGSKNCELLTHFSLYMPNLEQGRGTMPLMPS
jgi:hypothetical protein